ncbi:MAG: TolC family protein [Treponema sp.]|nr:TolC family protein [Treponema sp.]
MLNNFFKLIIFVLCFLSVSALFANNSQTMSVQTPFDQETLTFSQAADLAAAASVDLRQSYASYLLMKGAWRWGIREFFPRFTINVSENDRLQQLGSDSFIKNYGVNVEQPVFNGGRTIMARNLERMELDLVSSRMERLTSEIAEAAISAYRSILSSRAILEIRKSALVVLEEQKNILSHEVQLGLALNIDLSNAEINLAEAKLDILFLELDLSEMERQFADILGLDRLPVLIEKVDVNRPSVFSAQSGLRQTGEAALAAAALAREHNPDLIEARFSITKREAELKYLSNAWIPTLRLTGSFGLTGQRYPLTRYNWSVGLVIDLSTPWIQNRFGGQAGFEPPFDRTAMIQNSFNPLPDPASKFGKDQARLVFAFELEKYELALEQISRVAANAVEKCIIAEQRRLLAVEAAALGAERFRIEEIRLNLGQITRVKLMEILIEQTQREIAVIQAATALLETERELERFLDLEPGGLALFAANFAASTVTPSQRRD